MNKSKSKAAILGTILMLLATGCNDLPAVGSADYLGAKAVKAQMDAGWWDVSSFYVWRGGW